jgi:zinc protease
MLIRSLALLALLTASPARAAVPDVDIPYEVKVLPNGLTVVVHEDRKAPIVAVSVWYHVGSKNEVRGRTGFAHLFEHLMFQGSENLQGEYINFMQELGATDLNGTTFFDRTNYFQTVPKTALDAVLWAESDRMGHFRAAISQELLDEQRGVVQNEKRQGENQPYGRVFGAILAQVFPPQHPYSWETIGSMEDLEAASLDDVRKWFETYYGPNNAVIAIAGDISPAEAFAKVEKYFGDIPPGPPLTRLAEWIPEHRVERRQRMTDRVSQARLYMAWPGPRWGTEDAHLFDLASAILAGDKNSRLYQRLVYRDQIATDVEFGNLALEISGLAYLQASAQPGVTLAQIETAVREEFARFLKEGPTKAELERVRTQQRAAFVRGIEKVGGFSGKAGTLAESQTYGGSPGAWRQQLVDAGNATTASVREVAGRWITDAPFVLEVTPQPPLSTTAGVDDRSQPPLPTSQPDVDFPAFERATLANGLTLIVVPRPGNPVVNLELVLDAGYAADQFARPGTASLAMSMLDEGTRTRSTLEISEELARLGANLSTGSTLDSSSVSLSALADKLDPSLALFADVVLNPVFPENELERVRKQYLARLSQEKTQPTSMALRVLPRLLYGAGHPYAQPLTGTGTEATLKAITRADLQQFHATWFRPNRATLIAVGPVTVADLQPRIEKLFAGWKSGDAPAKPVSEVAGRRENVLYLVDRPGADQSVIFVGQLMPPRNVADDIDIETLNDVLGGQFTARINMNLRETKRWAYGAYSFITDARGQRLLLAYAPVQTDKTTESLAELRREFTEIVGDRPASDQEVELVKKINTLSLPGRWESSGAVLGSVSELVRFGLPDDYWNSYADRVRGVTTATVNAAGRRHLRPDELVFVVVGDRAVIEPGLKTLGFDRIQLLDADGELR